MAAKEAHRLAGRFSEDQRRQAVDHYRELALESCDIINLANLPEGDRQIATRQLELRRLYVPLRVQVEITAAPELAEADLEKIENQREKMRMQRIRGEKEDDKNRVPVGERLKKSGRMVLLGDPGAGKTTLIRWIATAYLLRLKQDPAYKDLPDVATLPDKDWLPIVIRCRDLDESCKSGSIDDVLCETFRKAQMAADETTALQAVIREMLVQGKAILLVDGLDEISNIGICARFCQQIERLAGNPMLLTTLALVKRKIDKLPNRRADLYWEAVRYCSIGAQKWISPSSTARPSRNWSMWSMKCAGRVCKG